MFDYLFAVDYIDAFGQQVEIGNCDALSEDGEDALLHRRCRDVFNSHCLAYKVDGERDSGVDAVRESIGDGFRAIRLRGVVYNDFAFGRIGDTESDVLRSLVVGVDAVSTGAERVVNVRICACSGMTWSGSG